VVPTSVTELQKEYVTANQDSVAPVVQLVPVFQTCYSEDLETLGRWVGLKTEIYLHFPRGACISLSVGHNQGGENCGCYFEGAEEAVKRVPGHCGVKLVTSCLQLPLDEEMDHGNCQHSPAAAHLQKDDVVSLTMPFSSFSWLTLFPVQI